MINRAFPPWFSWFLESKLRLGVLAPATLIERLPLAPDFVVAEVGSGTGVYARAVREHVRLLVGLELQWPLVVTARQRDLQLAQVQGSALSLPFRPSSFDVIYLVTVMGELTERSEALGEMRAALKPGGFLSVSEHVPDPDYVPRARLQRTCEDAGFSFLRSVGPWWNYTSTFRAH